MKSVQVCGYIRKEMNYSCPLVMVPGPPADTKIHWQSSPLVGPLYLWVSHLQMDMEGWLYYEQCLTLPPKWKVFFSGWNWRISVVIGSVSHLLIWENISICTPDQTSFHLLRSVGIDYFHGSLYNSAKLKRERTYSSVSSKKPRVMLYNIVATSHWWLP